MPLRPPSPDDDRSLGRNAAFSVFLAGQGLSALGDAFALLAVPLLMLEATGSLVQMGLVTATAAVGDLLASAVSGLLVDTTGRRRLMIACDAVRILAYGAVPLAWLAVGPTPWLLYVATFVGASLGNTFSVAGMSAVTSLVPRAQILDATGRVHAIFALMYFAGPLAAGAVSARYGAHVAVGVDALSFVASAASLTCVRFRARARARSPRASELGRELLSGMRFVVADPALRTVALFVALSNALLAARIDLIVVHVKNVLGGDDVAVGAVLAAASAGAIAAGLLTPALRRRWGFRTTWIAAGATMGAAVFMLGLAPSLAAAAAAVLAAGGSDAARGITTVAFRQQRAPEHLLGRVTAAFWLLTGAAAPAGAAATTALAASWGTPRTLAALGIATAALACAALTPGVRHALPPRDG